MPGTHIHSYVVYAIRYAHRFGVLCFVVFLFVVIVSCETYLEVIYRVSSLELDAERTDDRTRKYMNIFYHIYNTTKQVCMNIVM